MFALATIMAAVGGSTSAATLLPPAAIIALCIVAGVGTVMMLPGRQQRPVRTIGLAVVLAAGLILAAMLLRNSAGQSAGDVYFWIFSAIAVVSALRVVTHDKPVYSALYFVLTVVASAGLFVLLWAEFMAAALVLIYAGAILVTYVFVIMLAAQAQGDGSGQASYDLLSREPVMACIIGFAMMGLMLFVIFEKADKLQPPAKPAQEQAVISARTSDSGTPSGVRILGSYLFTKQAVSLELSGLLLTISMVGAVIIARRPATRIAGGAESSPAALQGGVVEAGLSDDPHAIPVTGQRNPPARVYSEA